MEKVDSKAQVPRPDIFAYLEYRMFLKDWFSYLKLTSDFSSKSLSMASNLSQSLISMVLSRQRHFSKKQVEAILPSLGLHPNERTYFSWLRDYGCARSLAAKLELLNQNVRLRGFSRVNPVDVEMFEYLTNWHFVAIREFRNIHGFHADPNWIKKNLRLRISPAEIRAALQFLESTAIGAEDGPNLRARPGVLRLAMAEFHRSMLAVGCELMDSTPQEERCFISHTVAIPAENFGEYKAVLEEARDKIMTLSQENKSRSLTRTSSGPSSEVVHHFGLVAFPITKNLAEDK